MYFAVVKLKVTVMLYMGRLVTQYRKSAKARLTMKMVVYLGVQGGQQSVYESFVYNKV